MAYSREKGIYPCPNCQAVYGYRRNLAKHQRNSCAGDRQCQTCDLVLPQPELDEHQIQCKGDLPTRLPDDKGVFYCPDCPYIYCYWRNLVIHRQNSCVARSCKCATCDLELPAVKMELHGPVCPERCLPCPVCEEMVAAKVMKKHMTECVPELTEERQKDDVATERPEQICGESVEES